MVFTSIISHSMFFESNQSALVLLIFDVYSRWLARERSIAVNLLACRSLFRHED